MEKRYETVFILTPVLSDDQAKEAAKKFEKILTDLGAKINHRENWGLKKLAYPIQKKTTGFYHLLEKKMEQLGQTKDVEDNQKLKLLKLKKQKLNY